MDKRKILLIAVIAFIISASIIHILKKTKQKKTVKEQLSHYMREEALNEALSNKQHRNGNTEPERPMDIQYSQEQMELPKGMKAMRLIETCRDSAITRQYLFSIDEKAFIGVHDGRGAVFSRYVAGSQIFCEFFSVNGEVYARNSGEKARLIRGKKSTDLMRTGVRIQSGDVIETPYGSYRAEIFQTY